MRKSMKKLLGIVLAMVMVFSITACNEKSVYKIGVTQFADHPSLDNCYNGFVDALEEEGFKSGENLDVDFQSARTDMSVASQIAQNFANGGKDLVCGIATPSAQTLYSACYDKGIPVVFNAVSDPVSTKLAVSKTEPMEGITGVSDVLPVEAQLNLIRAVLPDAKKIGILYTTGEGNSVSTIEVYKELAPKFGFEIVEKGIGNQSEIPQATDILLEQVDCISNMTDNTVVAALAVILEKANAKAIPVFGSEEEQVSNGCVACAGLDYYELGKKAGRIAARVLNGEDISSIPFETVDEASITVNKAVAESLGIKIPQEILDSADIK